MVQQKTTIKKVPATPCRHLKQPTNLNTYIACGEQAKHLKQSTKITKNKTIPQMPLVSLGQKPKAKSQNLIKYNAQNHPHRHPLHRNAPKHHR
jgi:hypothetical protein